MKKYRIGLLIAALALLLAAIATAQAATLTLTPSTLTMYVGETKVVSFSGGGSTYYIGNNGRPDIAGAVIKGSEMTVEAYYPGEGSVSVCSYLNSALSCAALNISVLRKAEAVTTEAKISFNKPSVNIDIGQTLNLTVEGSRSGAYYISANSNSENIYAGISGNIITLIGSKIGGTNVTVCQFGGTCGNLYAYVPPSDKNVKTVESALPPTPSLSAFYAASNNVGGGFLGKGATLSFKFNTSHDVARRVLKVGGREVTVSGSGTGPFTASYTISGGEPAPLSVSMEFTTSEGMTGSEYFTLGGKAPAQSAAASQGKITRLLEPGSVGADVTFLQSFLKQFGVYDGPITGYFGNLTEAAVKRLQAKNNLKQVGVVGPATRELVNKAI